MELLSIPPIRSKRGATTVRYGIRDYSGVLADVENEVANPYDVVHWGAATGSRGTRSY